MSATVEAWPSYSLKVNTTMILNAVLQLACKLWHGGGAGVALCPGTSALAWPGTSALAWHGTSAALHSSCSLGAPCARQRQVRVRAGVGWHSCEISWKFFLLKWVKTKFIQEANFSRRLSSSLFLSQPYSIPNGPCLCTSQLRKKYEYEAVEN